MDTILPRKFYERETKNVAQDLLGKIIVRKIGKKKLIARIVETEAYIGPNDKASHSRFGKTTRNAVMFGPGGRAYIYLVYGIYFCLNVATERPGFGAAVLIRAVEPLENITAKTNGPGLLCRTLKINRALNGKDLTKIGPLYILDDSEEFAVQTSPRIGVNYAQEWKNEPLRFFVKGNKFVSR